MIDKSLRPMIEQFFQEDDLQRNFVYIQSLPKDIVQCELKFKDDLVIAGLPFFFETFNYLMSNELSYQEFLNFEGTNVQKNENFNIKFQLPFNIVLTAERLALNLLQQASSIATMTSQFATKASHKGIKILDTRKTTPGLRLLEKYAVVKGGGYNHRYGQTDAWMVKDNHKSFFGGLEQALNFFKDQKSFYNPIVVEIHNIEELIQAIELNVNHIMLDNFKPETIREAVKLKKANMTYEVSGGITLENLDNYLIEGVDAISVGAITYNARHVDISLKYKK
jgi:nicotinate-nucleotide pyrophosphorylase (carboxylating)